MKKIIARRPLGPRPALAMKAAARLLLLAGLALAAPPAAAEMRVTRDGYLDIWNDKGGNVLQMVQRRSELQNSRRPIRIRGTCSSACTILTTLPNACLGPRATIGFHAPRIPGTSFIPPLVDQIMGEYYRAGIRDRWFGGWNRSLAIHRISARDYVRLDPQVKICDSLLRRKKR